MYAAMDPFLARSTWHTFHPLDETAFYRALNTIVRDPIFSADTMGDHMKAKVGNAAFDDQVDDYVVRGHAVRDYLTAIGEI